MAEVHDLHAWTLTSGMNVATAHLVTGVGADPQAVLDRRADHAARGATASSTPRLQVEVDPGPRVPRRDLVTHLLRTDAGRSSSRAPGRGATCPKQRSSAR